MIEGQRVYDNEMYAVVVAVSPKTPEVPQNEDTLVYSVVNKNTEVAEYFTNQLFEACQNADWLAFMMKDNNWQKIMQEKKEGFYTHFKPLSNPAMTAKELTSSGPLN
jgi:hypothetical protein